MATVTEPAGSATDRGGYLWETLTVLWPEPARVERRGRVRARGQGGLPDPRPDRVPRAPQRGPAVLLLPRRPRRAAAAALRHYKASAVGRRQLVFRGLAAAAQLGLGDVLPHRITVGPTGDGPEADVVAYLRKVLDRDLVVSLRVGPPRANRKPVLELLSPSGEMLGFAKVGITGLTRELVRVEAAALDVLAAAGLTRLQVPRLLHHGQWREHEVLVQTPLSGSGRSVSRGHADLGHGRGGHDAGSHHAGGRPERLLAARCAHGWRRAGRGTAAALLRVMDDLQATADVTSLAFGSWHGDWTPWNMASSGDQVLVWDWERFESGVPVGYDALHHQLQAAVERDGAGEHSPPPRRRCSPPR